MPPTVGIAGAGLIGRLIAFRLCRAGRKVTLFDRDTRDGSTSCTWAGAGMLAPWAELEKAEPSIAILGQRSLDLWPRLLAELSSPVFFQRTGSLIVAHRQDFPDLATFKEKVLSRLEDSGEMRDVTAPEITELEPELAGRFSRGLFFPREGQLEPRDLLLALARDLDKGGVVWRESHEVRSVSPGQIVTESGVHHFDLTVDSRGLGAKPQLSRLRGVRGELIRVRAPEVNLSRPVRLIHPRYPLYIVPRPEHRYLIGATSIESEETGPITVKSCLELLSAAYSLHPGFAEAGILETAVQCRPAFPDNLPYIEQQPGLIRVNGLYRHGFLIAPALLQEVLDRIDGSTPQEEETHAASFG